LIARGLERRVELRCSLPPDQLGEALARVSAVAESFSLVSKLSAGGIVTRVLRAPETELPFFGRVGPDRFDVAAVPRGRAQTPYQPILRGRVEASGEGSRVLLELRPHTDARTFGAVFLGFGVLLGALGLFRIAADPVVGGLALLFAGAFACFPQLRAVHGFHLSCEQSVQLLLDNVPELA